MEKISVNMIKTKNPVYFISEKEVREIVEKANPTKRIGDINIPELEKKLNQIPEIDSANVYLNLNGNLNLDIKQRVPAFRLNYNGKDFYVDEKGVEFPISKNYSFPCMLVTGEVKKQEYQKLAELIDKINKDSFSKKYFIGVSKEKESYNLLTSEGNFKVEIGDLDKIDFKVKGFKTFVEKHLIHQDSEKYNKVSVKYDNQIVTTLNPNFKENDSILLVGKKELAKIPVTVPKKGNPEPKPVIATSAKKEEAKPIVKKTETKPKEKPKVTTSKPVSVNKVERSEKKSTTPKPTEKKENTKKEKTEKPKVVKEKPTASDKKPETKPKVKIKIE